MPTRIFPPKIGFYYLWFDLTPELYKQTRDNNSRGMCARKRYMGNQNPHKKKN